MRKVYLALFVLTLMACNNSKIISSVYTANTSCEDCSVEIIKNHDLDILTQDADGGTSYTLSENKEYTVVKYTYQTGKDPKVMDSGYTEEFMFQLPNNIKKGSWSGKEIYKTNAILGVWCYCKGKAGYYKITSGSIQLEKNTLKISLPEVVTDQKLTNFTLQLQ